MNGLEKLNQQIDAMSTWHQRAKDGPKNIIEQLKLSPDDPGVGGLLADYGRRIEPHLNDFGGLQTEIYELDQRLRQFAIRPRDAIHEQASNAAFYARCKMAGWAGEETDLLRGAVPDLANIIEITWRAAKLRDGRELDRNWIREHMRGAAYSNEGWQKYLAGLPKIAAPEVTTGSVE